MMLYNVIDYLGNHIGVVVGRYEGDLLVAITEEPYEDLIDIEGLTEEVASYLGAMELGGINEELLEEKIMAWLEDEGIEVSSENFESAFKMFITHNSNLSDINIFKKLKAKKYILLADDDYDSDEDEDDDTIILSVGMNELVGVEHEEVEEEELKLPYPFIHGEIIEDPVVCFNNSKPAPIFRFNKSKHETQITFVSGDTEVATSFPGTIKAKKGDIIAIMLGETPEEIVGVHVADKTYLF
jgi:hypothetical protein